MKNPKINPFWAILVLLGIVPFAGLIWSVLYRNSEVFYVAIFTIFLPVFFIFFILVAYNITLYFIRKRSLHRKNKTSN